MVERFRSWLHRAKLAQGQPDESATNIGGNTQSIGEYVDVCAYVCVSAASVSQREVLSPLSDE